MSAFWLFIRRLGERHSNKLKDIMIKKPSEYETDLTTLDTLLTEAGIDHLLRTHPVAEMEDVKSIIGYEPTGGHQIIVPNSADWKCSIIRGTVTFGSYEVYDGSDTTRFGSPEEVVKYLISLDNEETKNL